MQSYLDLLLVTRPLSSSHSVLSALCRLLQGRRHGGRWPRKKDVALVGDSPALRGLENHVKEAGEDRVKAEGLGPLPPEPWAETCTEGHKHSSSCRGKDRGL